MPPRDETTLYAKAQALILAAANALAKGVKHYNERGELLTTPREIIGCLLDEGKVRVVEGNKDEKEV